MAILSVTKGWSRDAGDLTTEDGRKVKCAFTESYQVIHEASDTMLDIISAPGIPPAGTLFPGTSSVYAKKGQPQKLGPTFSIVIVGYEGDVGPGGASDSPENQLPEYTFSNKSSEAEVDEDWNGKPICTVNNEPIYGIKRRITDSILTVKRNFMAANVHLANLYTQAVNSDTIIIPGFPSDSFEPGQALLQSYTAKPVFGGPGQSHIEVTATIEFRTPYRTTSEKAWYGRVRHEGFWVTDDAGNIVQATDDNKANVTKPILLKSDGTRETDPNNAYWLEFQLYDSLPYNALGLW